MEPLQLAASYTGVSPEVNLGFQLKEESQDYCQRQYGSLSGSTDIVSDELWHQVLVSIPDGGSLDDASVYVDGKVEPTTGSSSAALLDSASNSTFTIGSRC